MEKMMTNDWIYGHTMFRKKKTYQMVGLPPSSASMIHFGTGYQSKIDDK
jgi:hypothetical protein